MLHTYTWGSYFMRRKTYVTFPMCGASYVTYLMWLVISCVTYLHMRFVLYARVNICYVPYVWGKLCYVPWNSHMWLVISYVTYLHMMFVLHAQENPYYVPYVWGELCYLQGAIAVRQIAWEMLKHTCKTVVTKVHKYCTNVVQYGLPPKWFKVFFSQFFRGLGPKASQGGPRVVPGWP